ncbi:hypothetical protein G6O67_004280 [Ophiocordyceps sinensis]|uniref:Uncharacterized protein n=1 Tax=Ophiocordyceps sinensis TaxID=72228 RepID=A0A8H4PP05_9HYPO|nr:hypothetical protein G6O67_004280 [Ophiocordyceps sinensis]
MSLAAVSHSPCPQSIRTHHGHDDSDAQKTNVGQGQKAQTSVTMAVTKYKVLEAAPRLAACVARLALPTTVGRVAETRMFWTLLSLPSTYDTGEKLQIDMIISTSAMC